MSVKLVNKIAGKTNLKKADVKVLIAALTESLQEELAENGSVRVNGLGTFKNSARKARTGRNPANGAHIDIPAKTVVTFKAGF